MTFKTRKTRAIESLNKSLKDLEKVRNVQEGNNWKATLQDILNNYTGPQSSVSERLHKLYFTKKVRKSNPNAFEVPHKYNYDENKKEHFKNLIQNAKESIQSNGAYKDKQRTNFLSGFNNVQIIGGIVVAGGILIKTGTYIDKGQRDREVIKLESQLNTTRDSVNFYKVDNLKLENQIENLESKIYKTTDSIKQQPTSVHRK
jgi:hypothetical protein